MQQEMVSLEVSVGVLLLPIIRFTFSTYSSSFKQLLTRSAFIGKPLLLS